ncbi:hypothetical protein [Clostridium gasigenes]|uniref:Uncharacterized protein n=1 Tax=Clostridium gasigenes TaxID=94869 RepID=A0A7X0SG50_9CLOT|nr:hypothetical protein [Clostridium gasigenes]MBB6715733.1 hypothetical protein [Clostridium gasigenes]
MDNIEKGKKLFLTMAIVLLGIGLFTVIIIFFSQVSAESGFKLIQGIIRNGLQGILLYYIFKGKKWAKIINIILWSMTIVVALIGFIFLKNILFIMLLVVYCASLYIIAFSPSVKEYLKSVNN